ncbi:MAG: type II toxin-antitoxin system RelE/ParE family toxin [Actinobacteria bacterium]|nr:type II toxin-antitoxin system RelE/ParE family toxin [Actinomycetota bacterium]
MLAEALDYISAERPAAALRWVDDVMQQSRSLAQFPDRGRMMPELQRPEIRELLVDPYRIPYRRDDDQVTVLAVVHARRAFDLTDVMSDGR